MKKYIPHILISFVVILGLSAYFFSNDIKLGQGAPTIEDTFDTYTDGDLNTQDGGTGFTNAWTGDVDFDVQGTVTYNSSAKAVTVSALQDGEAITRQITTPSASGLVFVAVRRSANNDAADWRIDLRDNNNGGPAALAELGTDGNINIVYDAAYTEASIYNSYLANNWYILKIAYECGGGAFEGLSADTFKIAVYDGSDWSAYSTARGMRFNATTITHLELLANGNGTDNVYADIITDEDPVPDVVSTTQVINIIEE